MTNAHKKETNINEQLGVQLSTAAIAQLGERQTEDLKVPGLIPGLGILSRSCLGVHLVSGAGLLLFGYGGLSGTMRFSCFENLACQAEF